MRDDPGNLARSLELAWKELRKCNVDSLAEQSRAEVVDGKLSLVFLGSIYLISLKEDIIMDTAGKKPNPFFEALIVHYLRDCKDIPSSGKMISFREIYGGDIYFEAFRNRAILPFIERFGGCPEFLVDVGIGIGGQIGERGDASVTLPVFPRIHFTYVIWGGDDEIPPSGNILFDSTIGHFLPTEDIAALGAMVTSMLIRNADRN